MSFMGAIGILMVDSGLTDLWETVYAPNTAARMETGHDCARALRAHIFSAAAVTKHIFDVSSEADKINCDELVVRIDKLICDRENGSEDQDWRYFLEILFVKITVDELRKILQVDESDYRTFKLWKHYLDNISILRMLLFAERTGNHDLHVLCVKQMIPILHATGHISYARSLRIYIQQLNELKTEIPANLYELYTKKGYFTVCRKNCFRSGNFTEQTIEQDLMCLFKLASGLTRERHICEGTVARFVGSLPYFIPICDFLEKFSGVYSSSSTQHKDLRPANKKQYINDVEKFNSWLSMHSFFAYKNTSGLVCITNGLIVDPLFNCDQTYDLGKEAADKLIGKSFVDTIPRKSRAVTIRSSKKSVNVHGENVDINPQTESLVFSTTVKKWSFSLALSFHLNPSLSLKQGK